MRYKRVIITEFGGPGVLKVVEETELPEPKPDEVRVKIMATSANRRNPFVSFCLPLLLGR